MDPQEGDIADLLDGRTAVYQGGRWVVQSSQDSGWQVQPMESASDQRQDRRLELAEETAARQARAEEARVAREGVTLNRQGIQSETDLRKEFNSLPDAKDFPVIASSYRNVVATANNDSAAGDLSLIFAFMKILDPNSVVREQEFANAQNAAGVPDQIRNAWNRALSGERLNPNQRADFVRQARSVYENRATAYNALAERYQGLAQDYGFEPENVAVPIEIDTSDLVFNQQNITEEEANNPNLLSRDGYVYDPNTDTWVRREMPDAIREGAARQRSQPGIAGQIGGVDRSLGRRASAFMEGMADTVSFGFDDEISAGLNTILPMDNRQSSIWQGKGIGQAYRENMSRYAGIDDADRQDVPGTRLAGQITGGVVAPGAMTGGRFIAAAPTLLQAGGRGAMVGAGAGGLYGAGSSEGGVGERLEGARDGAIMGGAIGGPMGAGGRLVGDVVGGQARRMMTSPRSQAVQTLQDHGVSLTPGQRMGGAMQTVENIGQRLPIVGPAIRGARERGVESLNRAVGNRALDPIGEGVPANVNVGGEMVGHVQGRLGAQFDRAYSMVPEINVNDEALTAGLARIGQSKADLPPAMAQQFDSIVSERLQRLQGAATGQNVGAVRSELNTLAGGYLRSQDPGQQALGRMIAELGDELDGAISRASPEAGQILSQAREGYADYIRLERASTAAGGRPFGPGQLETAVRSSDGSVRRGAMGRGEARMQDLSSAARSVMPDQFGNPGTADAGAMIGLTGLTAARPVEGGLAIAGLSAASLPYLSMGRKIVERLPANASRQELEAAVGELDQLARQDSNVIVLRDEIARRLGQATPAAAQQGVALDRPMTGRASR